MHRTKPLYHKEITVKMFSKTSLVKELVIYY